MTRLSPSVSVVLLSFVAAVVNFHKADGFTTSWRRRSMLKQSLQMAEGDGENPLDGGELVTALAKLDKEWQLAQSDRRRPNSRWTRLILSDEDPTPEAAEGVPVEPDFVYLLEPPSSIPSCIIVFLGGAGLGQFPHITYSEFLSRVADRLNAVVIAAPYSVNLDHFTLAKTAGEKLRKAVLQCEDDPARQYSPNLPTYCFAHSLGAKLSMIYMAATGQEFDGIGLVAYNNFGFSQTIGMAKEFASQLRRAQGGPSTSSFLNSELFDQVFSFAETAVGALGVEFTPSPSDTDKIISMKFNDRMKSKTRLFCFDEDSLDCSEGFSASTSGGVSVSGLPGNHLTPVYLKFGLDDVDLPPEAREMASEAIGGFRGASFGDEPSLDALVDEVSGFVKGKPPSRGTNWDRAGSMPAIESAPDS